MTTREQNIEIMKAWVKALDEADKEAYYRLSHPEHTQEQIVDATEESYWDIDEHWKFVEKIYSTYRAVHPIAHAYCDMETNTVIVRGIAPGFSKEDGFKTEVIKMAFVIIGHIVDGQVKEAWSVAKEI